MDGYRSYDQIRDWAVRAMFITAALAVLNAVVNVATRTPGQGLSTALTGIGSFVGLVETILLLIWVVQVRSNVAALKARDLQHSLGWTIAGFLIPIVHLWVPYRVVGEIWQASDPDTIEHDLAWREAAPSRLVSAWWAVSVLPGLVGMVAFLFTTRHYMLALSFTVLKVTVVVVAISNVAAAWLGAKVLREISARQEQRWERIQAQRPNAPVYANE